MLPQFHGKSGEAAGGEGAVFSGVVRWGGDVCVCVWGVVFEVGWWCF